MKQKKIVITICFVIICYIQVRSQDYIEKNMPEYIDKYITDKIIDSLRTHKISEFIIYQTISENKIIDERTLINIDTITVSYLIWKEKGMYKSFIITDGYVYCNVSDVKADKKLFNYINLNQLWIRKDEAGGMGGKNGFYYVPQYNEPCNKDIVVYITNDYKRFFELGQDTYYQLEPSRNKYRKEYITIIRSVILKFEGKWGKAFLNEKRWWGKDYI